MEGSDESGSEKSKNSDDSDDSDKSSEESEEEEEEGEEGGIPKWLPKKSGDFIKYSKKNRMILFQATSDNWGSSVVGSFTDKFAVKLLQGGKSVHIGFCPQTINPKVKNKTKYRTHLIIQDVVGVSFRQVRKIIKQGGTLYSQDGVSGKSYTSSDVNQNTVYGVKWNKKKGQIFFIRNGENLGLAFDNVKSKKPLHPYLIPYNQNSTYELVKYKEKKK
jgi:hypothetical protein